MQRWRFINDDIVQWEEIRKQGIDAKVVDPSAWFDSLSKDPTVTDNYDMHQYDHVGLGHSFVAWNNRRPPFDDKRVRVAMTHLIDRKTMLEVMDRGIGTYATCVFKRWYPEYSFELKPRLLDFEKARALLDAAGWKDTNGDGIRDKDGKELVFSIVIPGGRDEYTNWTTLWQGHMRRVGVRMMPRPLEWSGFIKTYYSHDWDACCLYESHTDPWIEPYEEFLSTKIGPNQPNHTGFQNKRVDEILEAARTEFDDEKRRELFHEFNRIRYEHQPQTYLLHGEVLVLFHKRFQNVKIQKRGGTPEDWWIKPEDRLYDANGVRLKKNAKGSSPR